MPYIRTAEFRKKLAKTKQGMPLSHGMSYSKEYSSYYHMIYRCKAKKGDKNYKNYVLKGITVCFEWLQGFENFYRDMGPMPKDGQRWTIERIDNSKGYSPQNCKWATYKEQAQNQSYPKHRKPPINSKFYYYSNTRHRWVVDSSTLGISYKQFRTESEAKDFVAILKAN